MTWQQVEQIYLQAVPLPPGERGAFLNQACADDTALRHEVESLLNADGEYPTFLETPPSLLAAHLLGSVGQPAIFIGKYRIVRVLGQGGMGIVYEAEQQSPRRTVALKVIRTYLAGEGILRRFRQETEALGRLHHPGIAQIYDAGMAKGIPGPPQPYFAMELIDGRPLLRYAEESRLDTQGKLELMAKVCDAVHHAHQRGILHRDLKPGNILVDQSGQPKVLDFGVARMIESDMRATRQTDVGEVVGTLAYMSPEQASGHVQDLDIRSDVYSLGVTLYELLARRLPYTIKDLPLHEALQTIQQRDAATLSSIDIRYRGDVDVIVEKALEKDVQRRYGSAAELASDIRRHLADEPITARPASTLYQLQKFTRRNRRFVLGSAAILVVLLVGVITTSYEAFRARAAERRAISASASAHAVSDFLEKDLLEQADTDNQGGPGVKVDPNLTVRAALDRAAQRIGGKFAQQPEVEADIHNTIAKTYLSLGSYKEAGEHLRRLLELRLHVFGPFDPLTLQAQTQMANYLRTTGKLAESEKLFKSTIDSQQHVLAPDNQDLLASRRGLARTYYEQGKVHEAAALTEEVLAAQERFLGPRDSATIATVRKLSQYYSTLGNFSKADSLLSRALETDRCVLGLENTVTLHDLSGLALIRLGQGRISEATKLFTEAVLTLERLKKPERDLTIYDMGNLAVCLIAQGRYAEAEAISRDAVQRAQQTLGPEHPVTAGEMENLGESLFLQKKYGESEKVYRQSCEIDHRALGWDHPNSTDCATGLALVYLEERKLAASISLAREVIKTDEKERPDHWERWMAESILGANLLGQKKFVEAESHLLAGYRGLNARQDKIDGGIRYRTDKVGQWVVKLYRAWGKPVPADVQVAR